MESCVYLVEKIIEYQLRQVVRFVLTKKAHSLSKSKNALSNIIKDMAKINNAVQLHAVFSKIVESSYIRVLYQSDIVRHVSHLQMALTRIKSIVYA